jgi:hypothetical protein
MRVIATRTGYYEHKRLKPGQEFVLVERKGLDKEGKKIVLSPEKQFSDKWMKRADEVEIVPVSKAKGSKAKAIEPEPSESDVI